MVDGLPAPGAGAGVGVSVAAGKGAGAAEPVGWGVGVGVLTARGSCRTTPESSTGPCTAGPVGVGEGLGGSSNEPGFCCAASGMFAVTPASEKTRVKAVRRETIMALVLQGLA